MAMRLPFEIREAVVAVCDKAFWLNDPFRAFFLSCGVPTELYDRYADESKFKIARHVLAELDSLGDEGVDIQRRLVTELARLRRVPDENVPNLDAARSALRWLKELAVQHHLLVTDTQLVQEMRQTMEAKRTEELIAIYRQHNEEEYSAEAFEAIRQVLLSRKRGGDITAKDLIRFGLAACAWLSGIMGLFALFNALGPKGDSYNTLTFLSFSGGAALLYLLRRYLINRWDAMGAWTRFFITLPCFLAIFAGALLLLSVLFCVVVGIALLVFFFAGGGRVSDIVGPVIDREAERDANLIGIRNALDDIKKKL